MLSSFIFQGKVYISVMAGNQNSSISESFTYTYPPPLISSVSQTGGASVMGGWTVTLIGMLPSLLKFYNVVFDC